MSLVSDDLFQLFFKDNSLVKQQLDSYNDFIKYGIQEIVDEFETIPTSIENFELKLGAVKIGKPKIHEADGSKREITPLEARLRNFTYSSTVYLEIFTVYNGLEKKEYQDYSIGDIPVMVRSILCYLNNMNKKELIEAGEDPGDPGGYFIINGSERVLVSIEDLAPNRMMVTKEKDDLLTVGKVFSTRRGFRARCAIERNQEGILRIEFPASPKDLNLVTLLRALGLSSNEEIFDMFTIDTQEIKNEFLLNIEVAQPKNKEEALLLFAKKVAPGQPEEYALKRAENLLDQYLLPHIGIEPDDRLKKAEYLIRLAQRTILVAYKKMKPDDRDHYSNKRVKLAGALMEELFRNAFEFLKKDIIYQISRADARGRRLSIHTLIKPNSLPDRIKYSMATGNWIAGQTGVSQLLDRTSYLATLSHLRRVISPLSKKHPHFKARDLHGTHWGKLCPNETPEGPSCSLVKNLSLLSVVSTGTDEYVVENVLKKMGVQ